MKLKLLTAALVGAHSYNAGDVVEVADEKRARLMIGRKTAEQAKDGAKITPAGTTTNQPNPEAEAKKQAEAEAEKAEAIAKKKAAADKKKADAEAKKKAAAEKKKAEAK